MEISMTEMYWLLKLDSIRFLFFMGAAVLCVFGSVVSGFLSDTSDLPGKKIFIGWTMSLATGCFFLIFAVFIPSTKQLASIVVLPKIINNEQVQEIPERLLDLGLSWLEELKPEKKAVAE